MSKAVLYLVCGKIASGKSTFAQRLSQENNTIFLSQDKWLSTLYPDEIQTIEDYARCFGRLSEAMGNHISDILKMGISVTLDFPANTLRVRNWMKTIADNAQCDAELHYLDVSDEICLKRLALRNQSGSHEYKVSMEEFKQFTSYFNVPSLDEGFHLFVHT